MEQETGSSTKSSVGCLSVLLVLSIWLGAVFILSHYQMGYREAQKLSDTTEFISEELAFRLGSDNTRLVALQGGSLEIYVARSAFESIPYPDRDDFVEAIADIWCSKVDDTFLPTLRILDIRSGERLAKASCVFSDTSPQLTGSYSGTVENKTASMSAVYDVQIASSGNDIEGCMQVYRPLYGSGRIAGTAEGRHIEYDVKTPSMTIHFEGIRMGPRVSGTYTVKTNSNALEQGQFTLHKYSSGELLPAGFSLDHCPTDADTDNSSR